MEFYPADKKHFTRHATERRRRGQLGSTFIEFALVIPFIAITFFGVVSFGIALGRYVHVVQVGRDLAHMYADGVDFTQPAAKAIAVQLAQGTGMTANGGNGVVILSRVREIYAAECDAAGYATCPNAGEIVFTQRVVVGNATLRASSFGTPNPTILNAQGNISPAVYLQNTDATVVTNENMAEMYGAATDSRAGNKGKGKGKGPKKGSSGGLAQGESPWIVEVYFTAPDISFLDFSYSPNLKSSTSGGVYAKFIF